MKPKINLCLFNNPRQGVLDQIWFAEALFRQQGYEFTCTTTLRPDCLNLVIENFVREDVSALESFSRAFGKQVGIIMTEHIDLESGSFTFGGAPLGDREYIGNKKQRLFSLLAVTDFVFSYFTLGDLPELNSWERIVRTHRPYHLPYPGIGNVRRPAAQPDYDIIFTGTMTPRRASILRQLRKRHRLAQSEFFATEAERAALYTRAKVAVTIPQTEGWKWVSPMRVLFGLRNGVPTVDLGQDQTTAFGRLVLGPTDIDDAVSNYQEVFEQQLKSYESFVRSPDNGRFPLGVFDLWAGLECRQ